MTDTLLGREALIDDLVARLGERSVILVGPRRVGKTTLLRALAGRDSPLMKAYVVDLQGLDSVDSFVRSTRDALLPRGVLATARSAVGRVESIGVGGVAELQLAAAATPDPWSELESALLAALPEGESLLVVALDELPWWLDAVERYAPGLARATLARLRRSRHDARLERVRWVFTGSVGLAGRAVDWDAAAELNDLDILLVHPLESAAGSALFEAECGDCDPAAARRAHDAAGGLPHWIRVLSARCRATAAGARVDPAHVDAELDRLLQPAYRHLFQEEGLGHFGRRYEPEDRAIAVALLDVMAQSDRPLPLRGLVNVAVSDLPGRDRISIERVFWRLVDEFYVVTTTDDQAAIAVPLFRRWWARWGRL